VLSELHLELVTRHNVRAACGLKVRPDQEGLVTPVAVSLASAYTMPDIAWPRLICNGDELAGFVMAAFDPDHQDPMYHSYLWRLNIGAEHQGKGVGRFAVESLCQEAARRGNDRLSVSYHPGERGPEGFYRRLGFHPTGALISDEEVAARIVSPMAAMDS
jgi:diamine N-acetyltransferase